MLASLQRLSTKYKYEKKNTNTKKKTQKMRSTKLLLVDLSRKFTPTNNIAKKKFALVFCLPFSVKVT